MVLIPEIVDAVGDTPVLGAGGIGHGRQMAAAMALGASGCGAARCGSPPMRPKPTRSSRTSSSPPPRRTRSVPAVERESTPVSSSPHGPTSGRTPRPHAARHADADGAHRRGDHAIDRAAHNAGSGAEALSNYFVGQIVGTMNESKRRAVVMEMVEEFIDAVESLGRQLEV